MEGGGGGNPQPEAEGPQPVPTSSNPTAIRQEASNTADAYALLALREASLVSGPPPPLPPPPLPASRPPEQPDNDVIKWSAVGQVRWVAFEVGVQILIAIRVFLTLVEI